MGQTPQPSLSTRGPAAMWPSQAKRPAPKKWREHVSALLRNLRSPLHNLTKILLNQMASSEGTEDGWCGETLVVTYV